MLLHSHEGSLSILKHMDALAYAEPTFCNSMTSPTPPSENNHGLVCTAKTGPLIKKKKVQFSQYQQEQRPNATPASAVFSVGSSNSAQSGVRKNTGRNSNTPEAPCHSLIATAMRKVRKKQFYSPQIFF